MRATPKYANDPASQLRPVTSTRLTPVVGAKPLEGVPWHSGVKRPAAHAVQTSDVDAPLMPLIVPSVHAVHTVAVEAEATLPYDPMAHAAHADRPVVTAE